MGGREGKEARAGEQRRRRGRAAAAAAAPALPRGNPSLPRPRPEGEHLANSSAAPASGDPNSSGRSPPGRSRGLQGAGRPAAAGRRAGTCCSLLAAPRQGVRGRMKVAATRKAPAAWGARCGALAAPCPGLCQRAAPPVAPNLRPATARSGSGDRCKYHQRRARSPPRHSCKEHEEASGNRQAAWARPERRPPGQVLEEAAHPVAAVSGRASAALGALSTSMKVRRRPAAAWAGNVEVAEPLGRGGRRLVRLWLRAGA